MEFINKRGQTLYNIFQSHINQLNKNGLSIIDAVTGYGKSYQARKYICDNCKNNKFIFLAPQKKLFLEFKKDDLEMMKLSLNEEPVIINLIPAFDTFKEYFLLIDDDKIFEENYKQIKFIRQMTIDTANETFNDTPLSENHIADIIKKRK